MAKLLTYDELREYLQKSGKPMDYDGAFGGECIDVVKYALDLCHGIKPGAIWNANELWDDKYGILKKAGFYRIEGTGDMQKNDLVFMRTGISFEHVGLFIEEMEKTIRDFDQVGNGAKVGWELPPAYRVWDKSIVRGVWRHKSQADQVQKDINEFCTKHGIRKRGNDEFYSCREILSILVRMEKWHTNQ